MRFYMYVYHSVSLSFGVSVHFSYFLSLTFQKKTETSVAHLTAINVSVKGEKRVMKSPECNWPLVFHSLHFSSLSHLLFSYFFSLSFSLSLSELLSTGSPVSLGTKIIIKTLQDKLEKWCSMAIYLFFIM